MVNHEAFLMGASEYRNIDLEKYKKIILSKETDAKNNGVNNILLHI